MKVIKLVCLLLAFLLFLFLLWELYIFCNIDQPVKGAITVRFAPFCHITTYDKRLQPFFTVTLDCRRVDSIRLWPLPIIYPWYEDWFEYLPDPSDCWF